MCWEDPISRHFLLVQHEQLCKFFIFQQLINVNFQLEENIRIIAFSGEWVKLMDDWLVEFPIIQSSASTLGTTQKRAPNGRYYKKRSSIDEDTADGLRENFVWWRGGKFTRFIVQRAALPKPMVKKAARQGILFSISTT